MYLKEVFLPLVDEEGVVERYKVSNYGRVFDTQAQQYVSHVLTGKPHYFYVNYQGNNKRKLRRVHTLIARAFIPLPDDFDSSNHTVDHIDMNKFNNSLDNLRWATKKQQSRNKQDNVCVEYNGKMMLLIDVIDTGALPQASYPYIAYNLKNGVSTPTTAIQDYLTNKQKEEESKEKERLERLLSKWEEEQDKNGVGECYPKTYYSHRNKLNFYQKLYKEVSGCLPSHALKYHCDVLKFDNLLAFNTTKDVDSPVMLIEQRDFHKICQIDANSVDYHRMIGTSYTDMYLGDIPVKRRTYYTINGKKQRRQYWCEELGVCPRKISDAMIKKSLSFKDALKFCGIDTTNLIFS